MAASLVGQLALGGQGRPRPLPRRPAQPGAAHRRRGGHDARRPHQGAPVGGQHRHRRRRHARRARDRRAQLADDYKAAVDAIRVGTGATGEALDDLEASFGRVAGRVREDIGSTATVMAAFNTGLGLTGDDLEGLTERAIKFARITKFDLVNGTSDIIRLFGDWSVASEDQEVALDKVFRASQATGIGVDELMRLMVQFGAPLRQLGYDFDSAAALMGKWEREGVNTELVIGGMRIALGKLAKEGVPAEDMAEVVPRAARGHRAEREPRHRCHRPLRPARGGRPRGRHPRGPLRHRRLRRAHRRRLRHGRSRHRRQPHVRRHLRRDQERRGRGGRTHRQGPRGHRLRARQPRLPAARARWRARPGARGAVDEGRWWGSRPGRCQGRRCAGRCRVPGRRLRRGQAHVSGIGGLDGARRLEGARLGPLARWARGRHVRDGLQGRRGGRRGAPVGRGVEPVPGLPGEGRRGAGGPPGQGRRRDPADRVGGHRQPAQPHDDDARAAGRRSHPRRHVRRRPAGRGPAQPRARGPRRRHASPPTRSRTRSRSSPTPRRRPWRAATRPSPTRSTRSRPRCAVAVRSWRRPRRPRTTRCPPSGRRRCHRSSRQRSRSPSARSSPTAGSGVATRT